jgi:hypothetical protein
VVGVRLEHRPRRALALRADDTAHGGGGGGYSGDTRPGMFGARVYTDLYGSFVGGTEGFTCPVRWNVRIRRQSSNYASQM